MAWTTPRTWVTNEALLASDMNTHIRDNLDALKAPPTAVYLANEATDLSLTSTSWADVDSTSGKFNLSITTTGGDVLIGFNGSMSQSSGSAFLDIQLDGATSAAGDDGLAVMAVVGPIPVSLCYLWTSLTAGTHTFRLRYKVSTGTLTIYRGAATASRDVHPQFWCREI